MLRVNQVVRGTIVEELADCLYIINFRGFNLTSRTPSRFKRGKRIFVRVTEIGDRILMRLLPEDEYREAEKELNKEGLDLRLEEIGITPNYLNRLITYEMLNRGMPLSRGPFEEIINDIARLGIDEEEDVRAVVYLVSKGYPRERSRIGLARFLDLPEESRLLAHLMSMTERELTGGEGLPVRVFDDEERSGICFRYIGDNVGDLKVIAVIQDRRARVELLVENEKVKERFELNRRKLEDKLGTDGLELEDLTAFVEKILLEEGRERSETLLGIDFRA